MSKIYTAHFGEQPLRFVVKDGALHVSRDDFYAITTECFEARTAPHAKRMLDKGMEYFGDSEDVRSSAIGESEIGAAIHWHLAGNILTTLGDLDTEANDSLRETAFRIKTLYQWLAGACTEAGDFFEIGFQQMMQGVKNRLDRVDPPFNVQVSQHNGWFVAECDALHLVTEAQSVEALTERTWELVPDLIELNNLSIDPDTVRLSFNLLQEAGQQRMAN